MGLEGWATVERLLVVHHGPRGAIAALTPMLHQLRTTTTARITLLWLTLQTPVPSWERPSWEGIEVVSLHPWVVDAAHAATGALLLEKDALRAIGWMSDRAFDAALIVTAPDDSPYSIAYLCYLAGIPIRVGQSREFGGGVLSHTITPPVDPVSLETYYSHLLQMPELSTLLLGC